MMTSMFNPEDEVVDPKKHPLALDDPDLRELGEMEMRINQEVEEIFSNEEQSIQQELDQLNNDQISPDQVMQEISQTIQQEKKAHVDTSNLKDLKDTCDRFIFDWNEIIYSKRSGSRRKNRIANSDKETFLTETIPQYAYDVNSIITALIKYDGWSAEKFGDYNEIYKKISDSQTTLEMRANLTKDLVAIARSAQSIEYIYDVPKTETPIVGDVGGSAEFEREKKGFV